MSTNLERLKEVLGRARAEIGKVIIGQDDVVNKSLITIFTGQHALIEGIPGVAKTLLVRTLSQVLGGDTARIQFTPDLMPADITGTNVFNLQKSEFTLIKGPVFTTFLLADEINRAPAKTQAALLQAMQERTVTIDRETLELSPFFTVFATQNPIEYEGTYPLPEAQKDRFLLKISMTYPARDEEKLLATLTLGDSAPEKRLERGEVERLIDLDELRRLRGALLEVRVKEELVDYMVDVVRGTRERESVLAGAGPRASQALVLASRAWAALDGRDFVTPDDVKMMAPAVMEHRIVLRPEFEIEGLTAAEVVESILQETPVPR